MAKTRTVKARKVSLTLGGTEFLLDPRHGQVLYKDRLVEVEGREQAARLEEAARRHLPADAHFEDPEDLCGAMDPGDIWETVPADDFIRELESGETT